MGSVMSPNDDSIMTSHLKGAISSPLRTKNRVGSCLLGFTLCLDPSIGLTADWPQWLGPTRDGVYADEDLAASWPKDGPPVLWRKKVGHGFSNPVVSRGRLILFHRRGDKEIVEALDAKTGEPLWSFDYPTSYRDSFGFDPGPRASPAVAGGSVFTFGAEGVLHCLDFESGKKIWRVDTHKRFGAGKGFFGAACSPLVYTNVVFLSVGGRDGSGLVAFDAATGDVLWTATDDEASYASPVAATLAGAPRILFFTGRGLAGADPETGKIAFQLRWRARSRASVNAATPLVIGESIFLSASYGTGAVLLQVQGGGLQNLWSSSDVLSNHYATSVYHDGYLYGYHGRQEYGPSLRCVELTTGKVRWSNDGFGAGTVTVAGGRLLLMREGGQLVLAEASPESFRPISKAKILSGTVRAYPAIADGLFYARSKDKLVCVNLRE